VHQNSTAKLQEWIPHIERRKKRVRQHGSGNVWLQSCPSVYLLSARQHALIAGISCETTCTIVVIPIFSSAYMRNPFPKCCRWVLIHLVHIKNYIYTLLLYTSFLFDLTSVQPEIHLMYTEHSFCFEFSASEISVRNPHTNRYCKVNSYAFKTTLRITRDYGLTHVVIISSCATVIILPSMVRKIWFPWNWFEFWRP
jgi:hypothetical protein